MAKHILTSFGLTDKYIVQFGNIMRCQLSFYACKCNSSVYSSSSNSNFKEYELALKTIVVNGYRAVTVADRASCLLDNYRVLADKLHVDHGKFDIPISRNVGAVSKTIPEMVHLSLMAFNLLKPQPPYIHDFIKAVQTVLGSLEMFKSNYDAVKRQAEELLRKIFINKIQGG